ncbi:MAG TPA: DUF3572 domain-containing protein [Xanthobacteraceae bacterium]|nr:DUF3572 domain-containing protein [Xanthobacteraceae bacterium]
MPLRHELPQGRAFPPTVPPPAMRRRNEPGRAFFQPTDHVLRKGKRMPRQTPSSVAKSAEMLAIEALAFLAAKPVRLSRFVTLTGLDPGAIRRLAHERSFLAAVLDHLAGDERLLVDFATHAGRAPGQISAARALLSGGDSERDSP